MQTAVQHCWEVAAERFCPQHHWHEVGGDRVLSFWVLLLLPEDIVISSAADPVLV